MLAQKQSFALKLGRLLLVLGLGSLSATLFFTRILPSFAGAPVEHVTNEYLFNEAYYLNQSNEPTKPAFQVSDFEVHGGKVKSVPPSPLPGSKPEERMSIYDQSVIGASLVGKEFSNSTPCWVFIPDGQGDAANGSSISMTYHKVGTLCDAGHPDSGREVDIRATYVLEKCSHKENFIGKDPWKKYDGRCALHFTDNFSLGTWQAGIEDMRCSYQFFDSATHEPIHLDKIYLTNTSLDRGEGFSIKTSLVEKFFLSNNAPSKDDPCVHPQNRWDTLPGTLVYDKSGEYGRDMYTFIGSPVRHPAEGAKQPSDSVDTIGTPHYYWRSVCCLLNLGGSDTITLNKISIGKREWSGTATIPFDPFGWNNSGEMFSTTNFLPLTNPKPAAPVKTIDKSEHVALGDVVTYRIAQKLPSLGHDGLSRYQSLKFSDELPHELEFVSARFVGDDGLELPHAGSLSVDGQRVRYSLSSDTLNNQLLFQGGECVLEIKARVKEQPSSGQTVNNQASVSINGKTQVSNSVGYQAESPKLALDLHADTSYPHAPAVIDYEYLNHDSNTSCSCIHYEGCISDPAEHTQARGITVSEVLPESTELVADSVRVEGQDGCLVKSASNSFTISIPELAADKPLRFSYDAYPNHAGVGEEVVHTARAWAANIASPNPGSENHAVTDDAEAFINDPALKLEEWLGDSAVESPDYPQGKEFRTGNEIEYHVRLSNVRDKSFARNIELESEPFPQGMELVGDVVVQPLVPSNFSRPISGVSDSVHHELSSDEVNPQLKMMQTDQGWAWKLHLDYLPAQLPCEVVWKVRAAEEYNGWEIEHSSHCSAQNMPGQNIVSPSTFAWINSPKIRVSKKLSASSPQSPLSAGYEAKLLPLPQAGTVARNLELNDACEDAGYHLDAASFKITEKPEWFKLSEQDIQVLDKSWKLALQRSAKTPVYWTGIGHYTRWSHGAAVEQAFNNPLQVPESKTLTLQYRANFDENALGDHDVENVLRAHAQEGNSLESSQSIHEKGARLAIEKQVDPFNSLDVGELCHMRIRIHNLQAQTKAHGLHVIDRLDPDSENAGMGFVLSSLGLHDQAGNKLEFENLRPMTNKKDKEIGFSLDVLSDLGPDQVFTLEYDMKRQDSALVGGFMNQVSASADGVPEVTDHVFVPYPNGIQGKLEMSKSSPKQEYQAGEDIPFTLTVKNTSDHELSDLRIHDELANMQLAAGSLDLKSLRLNDRELDPEQIQGVTGALGEITGFEFLYPETLKPQEELRLEYQFRSKSDIPGDLTLENLAQADASNTGLAKTSCKIGIKKAKDVPAPVKEASSVKTSQSPSPIAGRTAKSKLVKTGDELMESIPYLIASIALCAVGTVLVLSTFRKKKVKDDKDLPWESSSLRFNTAQQKPQAVRQQHIKPAPGVGAGIGGSTDAGRQNAGYPSSPNEAHVTHREYRNAQKGSRPSSYPWSQNQSVTDQAPYGMQDLSDQLPTVEARAWERDELSSLDGEFTDTISTPMSENQYLNALRYI